MTIRVGLVGTGYAARARAEALAADSRSQLVAVAGRDRERAAAFGQPYGAEAMPWLELVQRQDIDLVVVATMNCDHGPVAHAAVTQKKAVVVEYPLALDLQEAQAIADLAQRQGTFLHVEHIELLSGIHQTIQEALPEVGTPFYLRYISTVAKQPAPQRWNYSLAQFGFPLVGALSRIHRPINLFGPVDEVFCGSRVWSSEGKPLSLDHSGFFGSILCTAQLRFTSGLLAEVVYGKGQALWDTQRQFELQGAQGRLQVASSHGELRLADGVTRELTVGSRRGLFARDTAMVLDALEGSSDRYVTVEESLYSLRVADAARRSAAVGQPISLSSPPT